MKKFEAEKKAASHPKSANWTSDKGNPFDYSESKQEERFDMPKIKACEEIEEGALPEVLATVKYNLHLKTVFETISAPWQTKILQASEGEIYDKEKYVDGMEMVQDGNRIYSRKIADIKPITVYLDYPFEKMAEIKIDPYLANGESQMSLGYIIWQVSRAYAEIYKNRWKEFGVWGHALEDLYFEIMEIRSDNVITFFIGS